MLQFFIFFFFKEETFKKTWSINTDKGKNTSWLLNLTQARKTMVINIYQQLTNKIELEEEKAQIHLWTNKCLQHL